MKAIDIIDKYYPEGKLRDILIIHSEKVRDKALECVRRAGHWYDEELVRNGAMLHDIGIFLCDAPGIECHGSIPYIQHGVEGGKILRKEGYPMLARIAERHTGTGLTYEDLVKLNFPLPLINMMPNTIEEKAVCYADKFFSKSGDPSREKSLEEVIESIRPHGEDALWRFMELHLLFQ
ncbi:MAG: HDIG domain-containing protein [Muribaculaceae bacterium]|nr:HDIG domain-containing protein [Muribaculaceae bacterium]